KNGLGHFRALLAEDTCSEHGLEFVIRAIWKRHVIPGETIEHQTRMEQPGSLYALDNCRTPITPRALSATALASWLNQVVSKDMFECCKRALAQELKRKPPINRATG